MDINRYARLGIGMHAMKKTTRNALFAGGAVVLFAAGARVGAYLGILGYFPPTHLAIEVAFWLLLGCFAFLFQYKKAAQARPLTPKPRAQKESPTPLFGD